MKLSKLKTYMSKPEEICDDPSYYMYQLYFGDGIIGTADTGYDGHELVSHVEVGHDRDEDTFTLLLQFNSYERFDPVGVKMESLDDDVEVPIKIYVEIDDE